MHCLALLASINDGWHNISFLIYGRTYFDTHSSYLYITTLVYLDVFGNP